MLHTKFCLNRMTEAKDILFTPVYGIFRTTIWSVKYAKFKKN